MQNTFLRQHCIVYSSTMTPIVVESSQLPNFSTPCTRYTRKNKTNTHKFAPHAPCELHAGTIPSKFAPPSWKIFQERTYSQRAMHTHVGLEFAKVVSSKPIFRVPTHKIHDEHHHCSPRGDVKVAVLLGSDNSCTTTPPPQCPDFLGGVVMY